MKNKLTLCYIVVILLYAHSISATYIKDGNIVLLRSQYKRSSDPIFIDGILNEEDWNKAGIVSLSLISNQSSTNVQIRFFNDDQFLYYGFSIDDIDGGNNDSISIYFDVDADGKLLKPEDAKILTFVSNTFTAKDYYWDGDSWENDEINTITDGEFKAQTSYKDAKLYYEIAISLTSTNFQYDGFQVPTPANSFIGFTLKIGKRISDNETQYLYYPTLENNSSGYVDLKLAGPEDQDLPEYIPPVKETYAYETEPAAEAQVLLDRTAAAALNLTVPLSGTLVLLFLIMKKKRGKS